MANKNFQLSKLISSLSCDGNGLQIWMAHRRTIFNYVSPPAYTSTSMHTNKHGSIHTLKQPNIQYNTTQEGRTCFKNSVGYISEGPQWCWKAAEHIIEQEGSKPKKGMLKLNTVTAATAYVKSSPEHDAELRGFPRSMHLSKQKITAARFDKPTLELS